MRDTTTLHRDLLSSKLQEIISDVEDVARNIYYSLRYLPANHPARANLNVALKLLGVRAPQEVGLSSKALEPLEENDQTNLLP